MRGPNSPLCQAADGRRRPGGGIEVRVPFGDRFAGHQEPPCLTHTFSDLVEETGLPPVRLHDLRHGAARLMRPQAKRSRTGRDHRLKIRHQGTRR